MCSNRFDFLIVKLKLGDFRVRRAVGKSRRTEKLRTGNSRSGSSRAPRSPAGRVPMRQHRSESSGSLGGCRWKLVSLFLRFLLCTSKICHSHIHKQESFVSGTVPFNLCSFFRHLPCRASSHDQVWPLAQFFILFLFVKTH